MPTITVNKNVLQKIIGKNISDDKFRDRIPMLGTVLEEMHDDEMVIEINPNRPDLLSEQGLGRALSSFLGIKTGLRKFDVKPSGEKVFINKEMKDVRPYTACAIVKNLNLNDEKIKELIAIQEKLHITFCRQRKKAAMGIYPIEKIKPPIYFKCDVPEKIVFRPLEYPKELNAAQILRKHPTGRDYAHLVEGLEKYAYFEDSEGNILSFTPIINSHLTGKITDLTKEVFVEVSGFDFNVCEMALNILVTAMADMGADVYSMELVYPDKKIVTPDLNPDKMKISLGYVNKKLGLDLKEKELKRLLEKMGFAYRNKTVYIPAYRADIIHPIDLVEDISIAYGFENFKPEIPQKGTIGEEDSFEKFKNKIAYLLTGLGFLETSTYHLSNKNVQCKKMLIDIDMVELENSLTHDYDALRAWLMPNMLQILSENKHNEYPQNIFESGIIFKKNKDTETGVQEDTRIAVAMCAKDADFTRIRQVFDYVMRSLAVDYEIKETDHQSFITGRVGRACSEGINIAYIGEINPQVLDNFELEMPVAAFELNLTDLYKVINKEEDLFSELDIRVGKILEVKTHPRAENLYIFKVDTGDKIRQLVAGLQKYYPKRKELIGKTVLVLCNIKPSRFKGWVSEGMLLTAEDGNDVEIIESDANPGTKVKADGIGASGSPHEIEVADFSKIKMHVHNSKIFYGDKEIKASNSQIKTKKIEEGKIT